ncbi:uncharacterized protein MONBRDRAFT_15533, partial [Monosiga brevicollis MX1]
QAEIGDAVAECIAEGIVTREELFISSKLNNPYHKPEHVRPALEKTMKDLKVDYLDMYLMHWPTAFVHITGVQWKDYKGSWPPPHLARGISIHDTWDALIDCHKDGTVRTLGVCNFKIQLLHELMMGDHAMIPHVLQNEGHPYNQQWRQLEYVFCQKVGIQFMAYSPLGYGAFPFVTVLANPVLKEIADKHDKSTAQVALRWCVQRGVNTMPFSLRENELRQNLTVGEFALDDEDMAKIRSLDLRHHYLDPYDWYGLPLWD